MHGGYRGANKANDIAIINLKYPLNYKSSNSIKNISLSEKLPSSE